MPVVAPKFSDIEKMTPLQHFMIDMLVCRPNLAGMPHMTIPVGNNSEDMPVGLLVTGDHFHEGKLLIVGKALEE